MTTYTEQENSWRFRVRPDGRVMDNEKLALNWEVNLAALSGNYSTAEISAIDLFDMWAAQAEMAHGDLIPIFWQVKGEQAPFCIASQAADKAAGRETEDFLTFYTAPTNMITGDRMNWARLPLVVGEWSPDKLAASSDFIVTATDWRPSPFQPSVSLRFLRDCASANQAGADS